jgi:hypothetical protein
LKQRRIQSCSPEAVCGDSEWVIAEPHNRFMIQHKHS